MSIPPELAKTLNELWKSDLLVSRDLFFSWFSGATKCVAVGLVAEGPELVYEIAALGRSWYDKWVLHITFPESHVPDWTKVIAFIGWVLIAVGVSGEWYLEGKIKETDALLESINAEQLNDARQLAGDAARSAATAHHEAAAASQTIKEGLKAANQLIDMRGPRSRLLETNKAAFVKDLSSRAGQRIIIVSCDVSVAEWEPEELRKDLAAFLGRAGWAVESKGSNWAECDIPMLSVPQGIGGIVIVLSGTQNAVAKYPATVSANKLEDALTNIGITTSKAWERRVATESMFAEPNSFWKLVDDDPKAIFLLVGPNPLFSPTNMRTKKP